ncbi:unnamed protein product [Amoebophrya sp. A120]|nr:unnamed protein product [Amoebophrya sp. A120]|eukprot:GSA120T00006572001.1
MRGSAAAGKRDEPVPETSYYLAFGNHSEGQCGAGENGSPECVCVDPYLPKTALQVLWEPCRVEQHQAEWPVLAVGENHSVAIDGLGRPWSWGNGAAGKLGQGDQRNLRQATLIDRLKARRFVLAACGPSSTVLVSRTGALVKTSFSVSATNKSGGTSAVVTPPASLSGRWATAFPLQPHPDIVAPSAAVLPDGGASAVATPKLVKEKLLKLDLPHHRKGFFENLSASLKKEIPQSVVLVEKPLPVGEWLVLTASEGKKQDFRVQSLVCRVTQKGSLICKSRAPVLLRGNGNSPGTEASLPCAANTTLKDTEASQGAEATSNKPKIFIVSAECWSLSGDKPDTVLTLGRKKIKRRLLDFAPPGKVNSEESAAPVRDASAKGPVSTPNDVCVFQMPKGVAVAEVAEWFDDVGVLSPSSPKHTEVGSNKPGGGGAANNTKVDLLTQSSCKYLIGYHEAEQIFQACSLTTAAGSDQISSSGSQEKDRQALPAAMASLALHDVRADALDSHLLNLVQLKPKGILLAQRNEQQPAVDSEGEADGNTAARWTGWETFDLHVSVQTDLPYRSAQSESPATKAANHWKTCFVGLLSNGDAAQLLQSGQSAESSKTPSQNQGLITKVTVEFDKHDFLYTFGDGNAWPEPVALPSSTTNTQYSEEEALVQQIHCWQTAEQAETCLGVLCGAAIGDDKSKVYCEVTNCGYENQVQKVLNVDRDRAELSSIAVGPKTCFAILK